MTVTQLPQNYNPIGLPQELIHDYLRYAADHGYNLKDPVSINRAWGQFSNEAMGNNWYQSGQEARNVLVGPYTQANKLYDSGPFSWQQEDILSDVVPPGSDLVRWIPTSQTNVQNAVVTHISWVAPNGWGGTDYAAFLAGLDIAECEYGPDSKWNGFQYQVGYGTFSFTSPTFHILETHVMQFAYERSPRFYFRGPNAGLKIMNDEDLGVAMTMINAQAHLHYVTIYGDVSNSVMEYDGLDTIIVNGYVLARVVPGSGGTVDFANPLIIDGSVLATIGDVVQTIRRAVRFQRKRLSIRQETLNDGDMAVVMSTAHWHAIAEHLAASPMVTGIGAALYVVPGDAEERLNRLISDKTFNVDGRPVAVLIEDALATASNNDTTATGEIQLLVRSISGMNILEHEFINWDVGNNNNANIQIQTMRTGLGGIARYGWIQENQECYYFFVKMGGRLLTRANPYQCRITSVTVPLEEPAMLESATFTDGYYATVVAGGALGAGV